MGRAARRQAKASGHLAVAPLEMRQLLSAVATNYMGTANGGVVDDRSIQVAADSAPIVSPTQVIEFDLQSRTQRVLSTDFTLDTSSIASALQTQGFEGIDDFLDQLGPPGSEYADPAYIFGADGRTRVPRGDLASWPRSPIGRLWINWGDGSSGWCSGTMVSPYHFLTAGHCVHQGSGGGWASTATVSLAQDGPQNAGQTGSRSDYQYYGEANATYFRTYTGWTNSSDWNHDLALVTLYRNVGNFSGWFGYGYNDDNNFFNQTFNTSGYPADQQTGSQWFQTGNPRDYGITSTVLQTNTMDVWPGQSGSSVALGQTAYAVISSQWTVGGVPTWNQYTRINSSKFSDLGSWISQDASVRAPVDRADLVDWDFWFQDGVSSLSSTSVITGQSFSATAYPRNNGTATSGNYSVSFYLSTNTTISTADTFIGAVNMGGLAPFSWATTNLNTTIPNMSSGNYHLGWIIDSGSTVTEFSEGNNTGFINTVVTVTNEPDDTIAEAPLIVLDADVLGNIGNTGGGLDVDMLAFDVVAGQTVAFDLDTDGLTSPLGDSFLRIFDSAGNQIRSDDDTDGPAPEGNGTESFISHTFTSAGRYYIGISGYSNSGYNPITGTGDSSGSTGNYRLRMGDPNDQILEATSVALDSTVNSRIDNLKDVDLYSFTAVAGQTVFFDVDGLDTILRLFDVSGVQLAINTGGIGIGLGAEGAGYEPFLRYTFATGGTYFLAVSGYNNSGFNPLTGFGDSGGVNIGDYALHVGTTRVLDDGEPGYTFVGSWAAGSGGFTGPLGGTANDTKYVQGDATADRFARAFFAGLTPGQYRVLATYRTGTTNATNATYSIFSDVGGTSYGSGQLNQRLTPNDYTINGKGFESIATVDVTGTSLLVQLSDAGDGRIWADGVMIERIGVLTPGPKAEVYQGATAIADATGLASFGAVSPGTTVDRVFTVRNTGDAPLTVQPVNVSGAGYSIISNMAVNTVIPIGAETTFTIRFLQTASGVYGGSVSFTTNDVRPTHQTYTFNLTGQVTETQYIDDGDTGFTTVGSWANSSGGRQTDIKYVAGAATATKFARWTFNVANTGMYRVSASYRVGSTNASNADYRVLSAIGGTQLGQRYIDQRTAANDLIDATDLLSPNSKWEDIATVAVSGSQIVVELSDLGNGRIYADSIRIERVGGLPASENLWTPVEFSKEVWDLGLLSPLA